MRGLRWSTTHACNREEAVDDVPPASRYHSHRPFRRMQPGKSKPAITTTDGDAEKCWLNHSTVNLHFITHLFEQFAIIFSLCGRHIISVTCGALRGVQVNQRVWLASTKADDCTIFEGLLLIDSSAWHRTSYIVWWRYMHEGVWAHDAMRSGGGDLLRSFAFLLLTHPTHPLKTRRQCRPEISDH